MGEYLTPEEMVEWAVYLDRFVAPPSLVPGRVSATLRVYAKVVEEVAERQMSDEFWDCIWCHAGLGEDHQPDCIYMLARELRGHA